MCVAPVGRVAADQNLSGGPDCVQLLLEKIQSLDYVARVTFFHKGLQIRNSPFVDNRQFALIAVRQNGLALKYVSDRLRADDGVVLQALQQNGLALAWACYAHDPNLIRAAIQQNPAAVAFMNI